jgi:hypothetical protein
MNGIRKYQTASGETPSELDQEVNQLIQKGWQLFGNPYVAGTQDRYPCQAMVLTEDEETVASKA